MPFLAWAYERPQSSCMFSTFGGRIEQEDDCPMCWEPIEWHAHTKEHEVCRIRFHDHCYQQWAVRNKILGQPGLCIWCRAPLTNPEPSKCYFKITFDENDLRRQVGDLLTSRPLEQRLIAEMSGEAFIHLVADPAYPHETKSHYGRRIVPFLIGAPRYRIYDFLECKEPVEGKMLVYIHAAGDGQFADWATVWHHANYIVAHRMADEQAEALANAERADPGAEVRRERSHSRIWSKVKDRARSVRRKVVAWSGLW